MAKLSGKGEPTRKTVGGLGDIYTDITTGSKYECVFAYRDNTDDEFDCQWRKIEEDSKNESEKIPGGGFQEKQPEEEAAEEVREETPTEEPVAEEEEAVVEEKPATPKRTDYSAYSKNKKRNR